VPRRTRTSLRLAGVAALVGVFTFPAHPMGAATPPTGCPTLYLIHAMTTCYAPARLADAEQHLSVAPVSPIPVVARILHLPLTAVYVVRGTFPPSIGLLYLFGPFSSYQSWSPQASGFVVVAETVGRIAPDRVQLGTTTYRPQRGGTYVRWDLRANVPDRNLSLFVTSNAPKQTVVQIGQRILQVAK